MVDVNSYRDDARSGGRGTKAKAVDGATISWIIIYLRNNLASPNPISYHLATDKLTSGIIFISVGPLVFTLGLFPLVVHLN